MVKLKLASIQVRFLIKLLCFDNRSLSCCHLTSEQDSCGSFLCQKASSVLRSGIPTPWIGLEMISFVTILVSHLKNGPEKKKRLCYGPSHQVDLLHYIFIVAGINCTMPLWPSTVKAISQCEFFMSLRGAKASGSKPARRLGDRIVATPGINSQSIREFRDGELEELCNDRNGDF